MITLKKLNARGASHIIALMAVIVLSGIAGSYYLMMSHADSCTGTSDPSAMSDPVSAPDCSAVSGPVSGPVGAQISCVIDGVPQNPVYNTTVWPKVIFTNNGDQTATGVTASEGLGFDDGQGHGMGGAQDVSLQDLAPGASYTDTSLPPYTVKYASSAIVEGTYSVEFSNTSFTPCKVSFSLPLQPLSYNASCTISNLANITQGASVAPTITVKNTGTGPLTPQFIYWYSGQYASLTKQVPVTMGTIPGGGSASVTLSKYAPHTGYTSNVKLNILSQVKGVSFTCNKSFTVSVPLIKSVTVYPGNWQTLHKNAVVKDGSHGDVVRLMRGSYTQMSTSKYILVSQTKNSTTYKTIALTKLAAFVQADLGHKVQACVTARSQAKSDQLSLDMNWMTTSTRNERHTFKLTSKYQKMCYSFTLTKDGYGAGGAEITNGEASGYYRYLDNITFTLQ